MNMLFSFLAFAAAAVSAVPLVFGPGLLNGHETRVAHVHHGGLALPEGGKLRFLFMVPKLGAAFDTFATVHKANHMVLDFVKVGEGEAFDNFFGVADCATWHAGLVTVWGVNGMVHSGFTGVKEAHGFTGALATFDDAVTFVFAHMTGPVFMKLVEAKLPAHLFTFKLHKAFELVL